jgi:hypothetical protein
VLGDFFLRFRGGEVPDPDETYALRLAAPTRIVWLSSCWSPTDFTFWALGVAHGPSRGRWVIFYPYLREQQRGARALCAARISASTSTRDIPKVPVLGWSIWALGVWAG